MKNRAFTDAELVSLYTTGSNQHFAILMNRYQSRVLSYFMVVFRNAYEAEEVTQLTFIKVAALLQNKEYKDEGRFFNWLMHLARNIGLDYKANLQRKEKTNYSLNEEVLPDGIESFEEKFFNRDLRKKIMVEINELPFEQRDVLVLYYFGGYTLKQIATIKGKNIMTVISRMRYARNYLSVSMKIRMLKYSYIEK